MINQANRPTKQYSCTASTSTSSTMAIQLGLERVLKLLSVLNNPHSSLRIIHVAGTNGKGSVCALLSSILSSSEIRVGRFNSPFFLSPNDAVRINEDPVPRHDFDAAWETVANANVDHKIKATVFECNTATALLLLSSLNVDVAIIEVGMGGLLDATNVFSSDQVLVSVITSIAFDHVNFLGDRIQDIARHKSGIIKSGTRVVIAPQSFPEAMEVLICTAKTQKCSFVIAKSAEYFGNGSDTTQQAVLDKFVYPLTLMGKFQLENTATAIETIYMLRDSCSDLPGLLSSWTHLSKQITPQTLLKGLENVRWPGRLEIIPFKSRQLVLDGAHNPASASMLGNYIASLRTPGKFRVIWILGFSKNKDIPHISRNLGIRPTDSVSLVPFSSVELMPWVQHTPPTEIKDILYMEIPGIQTKVFMSIRDALDAVTIGEDDVTVVVTGSLYLVADVYRTLGLSIK